MDQSEEPAPEPSINSAAELCLYLIMILPDERARATRVRDFCRLYDIAERRAIQSDSGSTVDGLGRIFPQKK